MIIAKESPLILVDFSIINSNVNFIPANDHEYNFRKTMAQYPVEIDFGIGEQENTKFYRILCKISINHPLEGNPNSGYSLFAEGAAFFTFDENLELSEKGKQEFLQLSALSICITNIRLYLANMTSYFPFGKYQFPSIDINALLKDKFNNTNNNIEG